MKRGIGKSHSKIILIGEHSVVYGYPAVAIPLKKIEIECVVEEAKTSFFYNKTDTLSVAVFTALRYLKKENAGVSSARNVGLDNVEGDYITFIDADDWVDENYLELLIATVKKNHSDIVISSYKQFNNIDVFYLRAYTIQEKYLLNFEKMNRDDFLTIFPKLMSANVCFNNAVSKLFRKDLVKNLRFNNSIKYGEDLDFYFR